MQKLAQKLAQQLLLAIAFLFAVSPQSISAAGNPCSTDAECVVNEFCAPLEPGATQRLCEADPELQADDGVSADDLDMLNPLVQYGDPAVSADLATPGGIISRILFFAFPLAGLILLVMLVWGGLEITMGATVKKYYESGKTRIRSAVFGFILLFSSYWIVRVLEAVFGFKIF